VRISTCSVMVDDQAKALEFYTNVLGFVTKTDLPAGDFRWITVTSPEGSGDVELLLEPSANPAAMTYQKALFDQGIPLTAFGVDDIQREYERMKGLGVVFRTEPTRVGTVTIAVFEDTCGNLIQLYQA
jgi:catechol 2,3-dioxygenase-like lactoylglutathione lyase family enzyme